ncbi:TIGR00374 family protein [Rhodococcus sp. 15-725-2-2b]|uniref:lysylphosphatidylglycerol synthase transmembrane domain-containing protein n=1 Tax=unclassified Rhodococcus (in: high G+C Gram-positive bacteria) TaxID=192944 RepID=UPI000B9BF009|nr:MULTISPECIES: YbhN family protein [unclassified Rhodococcus (in: high G+C Gram-positive bacteria)]OZC69940.1 TIGR00374 family protein [Rhodococcus sp. 06-469-3-2]OZC81443.1 TIGR00374 family protein [Rhodococcus sp. 06-418-5]OZD40300.1 TIGR00374 family protein [Rhodococcus sp. 06-1477-1A]OZE75347.1 TIGR00374 family protein [Rhodococcus sp. 15-725-2-2b]
MPDPSSTRGPAVRRPRNRLRWVKWIAGIALVALLVGEAIYLWPRLHESWTAVREIHWGWLAACIVAQAVSLSAFGRVQKQLLDAGGVKVRQRKSVAVIYGSTAMALTLPAGQVFSTAFTYRETRRWGASPVVASWQLAISGVIAAAGLAVLGVAGGLVVGSSFNTFTVVLPIAGVIAIVAAVRYISDHPESIKTVARWGLRRYNAFRNHELDAGAEGIDKIIGQIQSVQLGKRDGALTLSWSAVHRLGDVACLAFACFAVGADPRLSGLLIAFAAGKAVGSVPLAPGGLVVVDATLIAFLTSAASISASQAVASALVYRGVSFILVAIVGWIVFLVLFRKHQHADLEFDIALEQQETAELRRTEDIRDAKGDPETA